MTSAQSQPAPDLTSPEVATNSAATSEFTPAPTIPTPQSSGNPSAQTPFEQAHTKFHAVTTNSEIEFQAIEAAGVAFKQAQENPEWATSPAFREEAWMALVAACKRAERAEKAQEEANREMEKAIEEARAELEVEKKVVDAERRIIAALQSVLDRTDGFGC
ncbi:hypothetical protein PMZ80_001528 [Knufia obscura]|uniref:Uncharacterized protein n=2 Tax=Knufia TaxID=430999 RepID=A0AAN8F388_9EURO|nr:hypothetical protein PMZ80_001528 [Knufia obscura]KAK5955648.1 hypothetical protein OHC33_003289 [Knufia fluminis]